ncbi:hypothetical protein [Lichenibacterium dinghuense]|uniref:hypothetical protein n=1 Tax=Lichenibacterium dinghuense TaxID=2895977 RepID=UPI001F2CAD94|nr:hypothetical protein [Lichenibacterium sp. 6Y81]
MLLRDRPLASAPLPRLPAPAPLPNLRDALARRAAIFGPVDVDPAPAAPLDPWRSLGAMARRVADALSPQPTV